MNEFDFLSEGQKIQESLISLRRFFHENPEISHREFGTAQKILEVLQGYNLEIKKAISTTGITALLKGSHPGPTIAFRVDMDALPVVEETGLEYKSKNKGVMHACGHDFHITYLLGAVKILSACQKSLKGNILFIFQPAEEINQGAKEMISAGILDEPKVDMIFGIHNHPDIPVGKIALKPGSLMAATDTIKIQISGAGSHGGYPHRGHDPILASSALVLGVQSIVSRNIPPQEAATISFGSIHGGTADNIIPDKVKLSGTVRSYSSKIRDLLEGRLAEMVDKISSAYGCSSTFKYIREHGAVVNDSFAYEIARKAANKVFGEGIVEPIPSMGGKDFSWFLEKIPGCFMWIGVRNESIGAVHPWHSPLFKADEASLPYGAAILAQTAIEALDSLS